MVGGALNRIGAAGLAALLLAGTAGAQNDERAEALATPAPAIAGAASAVAVPVASAAVMPAAFYGMTESPRSDELLRAAMLAEHNRERSALGVPALEWDDALAADAARYAAQMAASGQFKHSPRASRAVPAGENLWMGPRRLYGYDVMIGSFMAEKAIFKADAKLPDFSSTGRWQDVGHYTQAIWRGTKKVGCAIGDGAHYEYLVCRYFPAGNAFGKGPFDADEAMLTAPIPVSAASAVAAPVPVAADASGR